MVTKRGTIKNITEAKKKPRIIGNCKNSRGYAKV